MPNFGITDYGSQGRTRAFNVVDLQNCGGYQSVYTCLSRGSSANSTLIIECFDPSKVSGVMDGYLQQEFRELELMDVIIEIKYAKKLPLEINTTTHRVLIHMFREWKDSQYVPENTHVAICWSEKALL